ncbi:glycosyltransferase family 4 protein [Candidatus Woesebacteria bacterium]|nr:glycosyltransferase family 4 protein [Candidatus Woesebacteria bacterium]
MKIGIDCRLAGTQHAGIGRYIESLLTNLIKINSNINWVLFFHDENQAKTVLKKYFDNQKIQGELRSKRGYPGIKIVITPISHYSIEEQLKLPKIFKAEKLDLLHVPHFNIPIFYSGKLVVTIHDLLWHEYKGGTATTLSPLKYFLKYIFYKVIVKFAVNKAKKIIVPAETIKQTVIKFYPETKEKIVVTKEGADIWDKEITTTKKLKKTLLYVGSLYPHKNIKIVLRALTELETYKLLIVGSRNIFRENIESFIKFKEIEDKVTFLGYLSDEKLAKLYSRVTALVQPSLSEGFGLTGLEAMSLKTPILASNIPIFNEIYQDVAYYFSPYSETSFISAVHELENDDKKRLDEGVKLAKSYSWTKMAKNTLEVYSEYQ